MESRRDSYRSNLALAHLITMELVSELGKDVGLTFVVLQNCFSNDPLMKVN